MRTALKTCNLCEAACGLTIEVDAGANRVVSIRPDHEVPFSRGHICTKAFALKEVHEDPDRLRRPLRRKRGGGAGEFEPISWEEALDEAAARIAEVQAREGRDAVATYIGNPVAHSFGTGLYSLLLVAAIGSRNRFSTNSVDSNPRLAASLLLFGSITSIPVPDIDRTGYFLVFGANPIVSNGSIMTAPGVRARLLAIRARGGKLVVVDPRRTETARLADEHVFIRPGDDALVLAALVRTALEVRLAPPPFAGDGRTVGLDRLERALAPFAPEAVAGAIGIEAATIRRLAREFAGAAPGAVCYGRTGTCNQAFGTLSTWLTDALNIVTGNLDRPGGAMFATPAVDLGALAARLGLEGTMGRFRSRVRGLPDFNGELPVACLAEEVLTPGPGRIRGLVTIAANPVLSIPNGRQVDRALASLDAFVAIDIYLYEPTRLALLILPPAWSLEQDNYEALSYLVAVRNAATYSPAVLAPEPGARRDFEVLGGLALRVAERTARSGLGRALFRLVRRANLLPRPATLLDLLLRVGPHGDRFLPWRRRSGLSLRKLRAHPHGIDLGPLVPSLDRVLRTPGRRIDLAPPQILDELARLAGRLDRLPLPPGEGRGEGAVAVSGPPSSLVLVGRRDIRSNNSWGHNAPSMAKGRPRCTLLMSPGDAARLGLADGEPVKVRSRVGEVVVPLDVSDEIMPGVVSLPHGWGHDRPGAALRVAAAQPGASANDVTDELAVDPIAGNAVLNGVPVTVERA